ncbi:hypothetical protein K3755_08880 [Sulfitobacter pontiacus]|nr:hypothetical protein K3755_08880 [Sulfitobacter pontiacus]
MGCFGKTEYVQLRDEIPAELLEPTPISTRRPETYRELAILATEHLNSARQANADKAAIAEILGARGPLRTY